MIPLIAIILAVSILFLILIACVITAIRNGGNAEGRNGLEPYASIASVCVMLLMLFGLVVILMTAHHALAA